ncbi:MAG: hypothetical protein AAFN79_07995 [Pseudomonadota bacterium]
MRVMTFIGAGLATFAYASAAFAQAISLTLANPQPDASALKPGLAVEYAYPADIKWLSDAESWFDYGSEVGEPLIGFDYPDTLAGEKALTSKQSEQVIARITGYIRFDEAGSKQLDWWTNDGLLVEIGGTQVFKYDGRHPCESNGAVDVTVPAPGWYEIEAIWFQRIGSACLLMQWGEPGGDLGWTPNDAFAHKP